MIGEKFKAVRKAKKLTLEKAAKALGLKSTGHLSQVERDEKEPSDSLINNFKATFSVSENWWETGDGDMFSARLDGRKLDGFQICKDVQKASSTRMMLEDLLDQESEEELKEMVFKLLEKQRGAKGGN